MNKGRVIGLLKQHGDAVLTTTTTKQSKPSYDLCTLDFKNKHIKSRTRGKKPWPKNNTDIVVFNWTEDKYWILNPKLVIKITPLSDILKNKR